MGFNSGFKGLKGSDYQQSGERNPSVQMTFLGKFFKLDGGVMIPYLTRLLDITMNNNASPGDWKKDIVVPIYKEGDRALVGNYTQTCQPNLGGLQTNGAGYIRVPKTSMGNEWVVI